MIPSRVSIDYLTGVATGNGYAEVVRGHDRLTSRIVLRGLYYNTRWAIGYPIIAWREQRKGNPRGAFRAKVLASAARGRLKGLLHWLRPGADHNT